MTEKTMYHYTITHNDVQYRVQCEEGSVLKAAKALGVSMADMERGADPTLLEWPGKHKYIVIISAYVKHRHEDLYFGQADAERVAKDELFDTGMDIEIIDIDTIRSSKV